MKNNIEIPKAVREYMSAIARRQLETMTPEQRTARARRAVNARWRKARKGKGAK